MRLLFLFIVLFYFTGCTQSGDETPKSLQHYNFEQSSEIFLPSELREISGLAFINGKIYAHNDEKGTVFILDPSSGKIIKQFDLGIRPIKKDFEGIASAGGYLYMITSSGVIYKFEESDSSYSNFKEFKTPLTVDYDIEGLCYDDSTNSLLIACKEYPNKKERNVRPVFSFDLETNKLINRPRFIISLKELKDNYGIKNFSPSGIEKNADGNFYILSSVEKAIAVVSPEGKILEAAALPSKHMQPEGITFLPDKNLIICDEGGKDDAELTLYRFNSGSE